MVKLSEENMKVIQKILQYVIVILILLAIFLGSLVLTSLIPSDWMKENVKKSAQDMKAIGEKDVVDMGYKKEVLFIFTDALMVNTAYSVDNAHPLESSLLARRDYLPGQTTFVHADTPEGLVSPARYYEEGESRENAFQTEELWDTAFGIGEEAFEYARYWHGYLIFLRPLLCFFDYGGLRILSAVAFALFIIALAILTYKKLGIAVTIAVLLSFLGASVGIATQSISTIIPFFIAVIASIYLLARYEKMKNVSIFFFVIGACTCFFDLLTTPLVTFGIPAVFYFLCKQKEENLNLKQEIIGFLKIGIAWVAGFGILWLAKWVITDALYGRNLISIGLGQVGYRMSGEIKKASLWKEYELVLKQNFYYFTSVPMILIIVASIGYFVARVKKVEQMKVQIKELLPYFIIVILPFIWYLVLRNHSSFHAFFTYRNWILTLLGAQMIVIKIAGYKKERNVIKSEKN